MIFWFLISVPAGHSKLTPSWLSLMLHFSCSSTWLHRIEEMIVQLRN